MHFFKTWDQVKVTNEDLEDAGRAGVVGSLVGHGEDEVPVKLDGDDSETVFQASDLKAV